MKMAAEENITYGQSFNSHILQAEFELVENLKAALKSESDIILDQLNLTVAVRRKKLLRVPPEVYDRIAVGFDIDDNVIIERNNERAKVDRGIPEPILRTYMERFTMPTIKEGFDEIWGKDDILF
jgi:tRNA uridine 5-carbamoylmethylation protein Kti12